MEYTKVQRSLRDQPRWKLASCQARGAWITLAGFCSDTENGGVIALARGYTDAQWMSLAQLRTRDVEAAVSALLLSWNANDLHIEGYDCRGEGLCLLRRQQGKVGGMKSGATRREQRSTWHEGKGKADAKPNGEANGSPLLRHDDEPSPDQPRPDQAATAAAHEADPRLEAAAAAGAYLDWEGENQRPAWLLVIGDMTPEQVTSILSTERLPDGRRIRLPSGFEAAVLAVAARVAETRRIERTALTRRQEQERAAEAAAKAEAERPAREERARAAAAERERAAAARAEEAAALAALCDDIHAGALRHGQAIIAAVVNDQGLIAKASGATVKSIANLRRQVDDGHVQPITIDAILHDLPALRAFTDPVTATT